MLFTTPIFYVNARPHLGHAYSLVLTDALTRWHRLRQPHRLIQMSTGTDEHGQKIFRVAEEKGVAVQEWCDSVSQEFRALAAVLNIVPDHRFIRTTSPEHRRTVLSFWNQLCSTGAVYKGKQEGWYGVADESFYSPQEVLTHPHLGPVSRETGRPVTWITEDNYRFRLYQFIDPVQEWLRSGAVQPASRVNDVMPFLREIREQRLELSVSRRREVVRWGIPVPGDEQEQLIYVWIDALANYLGCGESGEMVHVIGKDILKFHAIYWPALLSAAGLPLPSKIIAHGHVLHSSGQKMSKSLGNVIDPLPLIREDFNGDPDPLRYYLLRTAKIDADGQFSGDEVRECYRRELVGSLGNLISRVFKGSGCDGLEGVGVDRGIADDHSVDTLSLPLSNYNSNSLSPQILDAISGFNEQVPKHFSNHRLPAVADCLQSLLSAGNAFLSAQQPWNHPLRWPACRANIHALLNTSLQVVEPFIPGAAQKIKQILAGRVRVQEAYCDVYLTHDAPRVRKDHTSGWKHAAQVRAHYLACNQDKMTRCVGEVVKDWEEAGEVVQILAPVTIGRPPPIRGSSGPSGSNVSSGPNGSSGPIPMPMPYPPLPMHMRPPMGMPPFPMPGQMQGMPFPPPPGSIPGMPPFPFPPMPMPPGQGHGMPLPGMPPMQGMPPVPPNMQLPPNMPMPPNMPFPCPPFPHPPYPHQHPQHQPQNRPPPPPPPPRQ